MWVIEKHRKGKRHYGWFIKDASRGITIYIARRWFKEIYREGEPTISEAKRKGTAAWAIDHDVLQLCRIKGVKYVGVKLRDKTVSGWYLTTLDNYYNRKVARHHNYTGVGRGGSAQAKVPLQEFKTRIKVVIK